MGRWAEPFSLLAFGLPVRGPVSVLRRHGLHKLALIINVVRGDLSWIGPRALREEEVSAEERIQWRRWDLRPGLLNLWWIRQRANIAFSSEWETDAEYIRTQTLAGDASMVMRALPGRIYGGAPVTTTDTVSILGHRVDNLSMSETLSVLDRQIRQRAALQVCFLNADCVNRAWHNPAYKSVLNGPVVTLADGIGLKLAGRILNQPIRQNVNGTDLFPRLCELLARENRSLYLLGARPGVAEAVADRVRQNYPGIQIAGVRDGYFSGAEDDKVVADIASSGADVLLVAFGAPRQDTWIAERLPRLGVPVAMGVGGLFDFYSGRIPRAPQWMREMGLEWVYRFLQEPGRMWKRYFGGNFVFLFRVFRSRIRPLDAEGVKQ
jgi:N-acetylglucosaminyldiphosphoundecaprenol N-acetyl-beta-D-mannosaminyltransferase